VENGEGIIPRVLVPRYVFMYDKDYLSVSSARLQTLARNPIRRPTGKDTEFDGERRAPGILDNSNTNPNY
jgi:hypothetical protein